MAGVHIRFFKNEDDVIEKVKVKRYVREEKVSDYTFRVGSELVIKPLNKRQTKNRDRRVKVLGFDQRDEKSSIRVKVKYLDTNRNGFVEIDVLDTFK